MVKRGFSPDRGTRLSNEYPKIRNEVQERHQMVMCLHIMVSLFDNEIGDRDTKCERLEIMYNEFSDRYGKAIRQCNPLWKVMAVVSYNS